MLKWLEGFFLDDKGSKSMSRLGHFAGLFILGLLALIAGLLYFCGHEVSALLLLLVKIIGGSTGGGYSVGKIADAFGGESSNGIEEDATVD